ncbi:MAG: hypothetical protein M3Z33_02695 [Actinomycetota bacterium]|nr:hypothetical protein [Actinomycetota bacterium]
MTRPRIRLLGSTLGAAAAVVAAAPAAAAPTLTTDRGCYTYHQPVQLSGSGYQPGAAQTVSLDGTPLPAGSNTFVPTAQGKIPPDTTLDAPAPDAGKTSVRTYTVTTADSSSGTPVTARAKFAVVHTNVNVTPPFITPGRVRYTALGFTYGANLYVHYLKGRKQRHVATRLVGPVHGACGRLRRRVRMFLFRPVRPATYTLVFDNNPTYAAAYRPNFSFQAIVTKPYF